MAASEEVRQRAWSTEQFAELCGLPLIEIDEAVAAGELPTIRLGRLLRIVDQWPEGVPEPEAEEPQAEEPAPEPVLTVAPEAPRIFAALMADLGLVDTPTEYHLRQKLGKPSTLAEERAAIRRLLKSSLRKVRGSIPAAVRREVLERDGRVCQYCGRTIAPKARLELDHVRPVAQDGEDTAENLVVSCKRCNSMKAAQRGWRDRKCGHPRFETGQCRRCRADRRRTHKRKPATHACHPPGGDRQPPSFEGSDTVAGPPPRNRWSEP